MKMPKWELKEVYNVEEANEFGKNGWEPIGVDPCTHRILLKRSCGYRIIEERDVSTGQIINNVTAETSVEYGR